MQEIHRGEHRQNLLAKRPKETEMRGLLGGIYIVLRTGRQQPLYGIGLHLSCSGQSQNLALGRLDLSALPLKNGNTFAIPGWLFT